MIARFGFKMFLGVDAEVAHFSEGSDEEGDLPSFSILFPVNPLATFVELPSQYASLWFSNLLCGVIRGACEMVRLKVEVFFEQDELRGGNNNEIKVRLLERMAEEMSDEYKED